MFPATIEKKQMYDKEEFDAILDTLLKNLGAFLRGKNEAYGNSALSGLDIFGHYAKTSEQLGGVFYRLDDKLARIKNSEELRENDVVDLIGYLLLLCIAKGYGEELLS